MQNRQSEIDKILAICDSILVEPEETESELFTLWQESRAAGIKFS